MVSGILTAAVCNQEDSQRCRTSSGGILYEEKEQCTVTLYIRKAGATVKHLASPARCLHPRNGHLFAPARRGNDGRRFQRLFARLLGRSAVPALVCCLAFCLPPA
jgi:hypothetical protein